MEIWGSNQAADNNFSSPGLDIWVYSRPHGEAAYGGDVYYVSLCGGGVITRFILADVSGHGAVVGDLARSLRDLMRRNINRKSQDRLVKQLNRQFTELAQLRRFATALVATYLTTSDKLTVSNAGHPRPLWYQASARQWSFLVGPDDAQDGALANLPLGIDEAVSFAQTEIVLNRGDLVLFYTDALTETTDAAGKVLGEARLLALLDKLDAAQPTRLAAALIQRLDSFREGRPPEDDFTFMLLSHNAGNSPRLTLRQKLDVYAKVFHLKSV
jgi:serine phosphatase RsbU (regulator of sigma subunit)